MTQMTRSAMAILSAATLMGYSAAAQQPVQFKANLHTKNGADGTTTTGVVYFGGAKMRTELSVDGQDMVIVADPAARSQLVLMPSDKMYMQMPIGQGPVSVPVSGPTDPANPCSSGGNTDCVRGPAEAVNGIQTVRWDYTSPEGTRTRAWISSRLRFAIKTTDDNGSLTEYTNIVEGAQPANLFAIPAGYTKMDVGAMGGMERGNEGRGRGRGRGNLPSGTANLPPEVAAAMANLPPEAAAAMASAMRDGRGQLKPTGLTGSAWEKGKGWILALTITGSNSKTTNFELGTYHETYSVKYVASIPLNWGTPSAGISAGPGPMWTHIASEGMGSPEVLATPLTLTVETESKADRNYKGVCGIGEDPNTSVSTTKGGAEKSVSIKQPDLVLRAQSVFKIAPDLKTYDLLAVAGTLKGKEVTQTRVNGKACRDGHAYVRDTTTSLDVDYDIAQFDVKGLPLPASVSTISGSKKMPMRLGGQEFDATVLWTLTPIR